MSVDTNTDDIKKSVLSPKNFFSFYKNLLCLRFPIKVSDVLELRHLINNSIESYREPFDIPDFRQFRDALRSAIHSFGIENERHCIKLLKILAMVRDLHYMLSIDSRDAELRLRDAMKMNRRAKKQSLQYGVHAAIAAGTAALVWVMLTSPGWIIKLVSFTLAYVAWDYFHSLSTLDRDYQILKNSLNKVIRKRVNSINWKLLIHKLSLILGYKQIRGIEVFRIEHDQGHNVGMH